MFVFQVPNCCCSLSYPNLVGLPERGLGCTTELGKWFLSALIYGCRLISFLSMTSCQKTRRFPVSTLGEQLEPFHPPLRNSKGLFKIGKKRPMGKKNDSGELLILDETSIKPSKQAFSQLRADTTRCYRQEPKTFFLVCLSMMKRLPGLERPGILHDAFGSGNNAES